MKLLHHRRAPDAYVDHPIDRSLSDELASLTRDLISRSVRTTMQASEVMRMANERRAARTEGRDGRIG